MTLRTPDQDINVDLFRSQPYVVAPTEWRCRPEKRGKAPLYRKLVAEPVVLDSQTIVITTRKAYLVELFRGKLKVARERDPNHDVLNPTQQQRRSLWNFKKEFVTGFAVNWDPIETKVLRKDMAVTDANGDGYMNW